MSLHEAIHRMMDESTKNNSKFISLKNIYVHLKNKNPEASSEIIFDGFLYKYEHLKEKSALYILNEGKLWKVNTNYRAISSQPSSFEGLGKYVPNSLSKVISDIRNDPLVHKSAIEYGFIRDEINMAMGEDFPEASLELRDYEAELAKLRAEIEELRAENTVLRASKKEPHPTAEKYAVVREDVLSAMIAVLFHPDIYIDEKQVQRVKLPSLTIPKLVEIVKAALPSQQQLVDVVDQKSPIFWPYNSEPPLEDSIMRKHLSKAINRIPD